MAKKEKSLARLEVEMMYQSVGGKPWTHDSYLKSCKPICLGKPIKDYSESNISDVLKFVPIPDDIICPGCSKRCHLEKSSDITEQIAKHTDLGETMTPLITVTKKLIYNVRK